MVHKVWLYFTTYSWVDVEADTLDKANEIAWKWQAQGYPLGEGRLESFPEIKGWGR